MSSKMLTLGEMFSFPSIRGVTEHYVHLNPGNIPVYGGRKTGEPIGYIADNLDDVKYFENCLAWNRQGSVGYVFFHNHKFATTDDHRPMYLKEEYINSVYIEYLQIQIQAAFLSSGFAWGKTAGKEKIKDIYISLPIDECGNLNISRQKELVEKYLPIKSIRNRLNEYARVLRTTQVQVRDSFQGREVFLSNESLFHIQIGKRVLKKDLLIEGVPIYSANVARPFGFVAQSHLISFDKDSLIWGIDGNFDWAYIPKGIVFDITDHSGRLQIKSPDILSEYAYYRLRESSTAYGFNRTFRASLENIKSVSINVPINDKGEFDVVTQIKLIQKYRKIDSIKYKLTKLIDSAINPQVEV